jgi:hypothetical protein
MSLAAACGWSLARSAAVAILAWPVCKRACAWLHGMPGHRRPLAWCLAVLPFLCPELWAGYAYSGFSLLVAGAGFWDHLPAGVVLSSPQWVHVRNAAIDELLFDLLLFLRAVPVGTLVAYFASPPPLSPEAIYCFRLAQRQTARGASGERQGEKERRRQGETAVETSVAPRLSLSSSRAANRLSHWLRWKVALLQSNWSAAMPAVGLMFLLSFQEFELASLIGRPAWTVWLFDAQVGGLALGESLRRALYPVFCQLAILVPLVATVVTARALPSAARAAAAPLSRSASIALWSFAGLGAAMTVGVPVLLVGRGTLDGMSLLLRDAVQLRTLLREVLIGTGYGLVAAAIGMLLAAWLLQIGSGSRTGRVVAVAAVLPGLFGSLILGLALIRLLQQPFLHVFYKTPLSLTAALVLFLLPRALLLRLAVWSIRPQTGAHLARLLREAPSRGVRDRSHELAWQMRWRGEFWSLALLTYWGFLDLTVAYLLAPVTIVSTPVMLYNQMHFGKNAALSARVFVAVLLPALCFCLVSALRRPLSRWLWR